MRAILALLTLAPMMSWAVSYTVISDTILLADGTAMTGEVRISWSTFQTSDGATIAGASKRVSVTSGSFSTSLAAGGIYTASYVVSGRIVSRETWTVPVSAAPLRISDIRTVIAPGAHASTHGVAGSDPVTVAMSQVTGLQTTLGTLPVYTSGSGAPTGSCTAPAIYADTSTAPDTLYHCTSGAWAQIGSSGGTAWGSITGTLSAQTDLQSALDAKATLIHNHDASYVSLGGSYANPTWLTSLAWSKLTGVPTTFTPSSHTHDAADILNEPWPTYSSGSGAPSGSCTAPAVYVDTSTTPDALYHCSSAAWVQVGDGGGGSSLPSQTGHGGKLLTTDGTTAAWESLVAGSAISITQTIGQKVIGVDSTVVPYLALDNAFLGNQVFAGDVQILEQTAPGAGTAAGQHQIYFDASDSKLKSHEYGGSVVTYLSEALAASSYQPLDSDLTALASMSCTEGQIPKFTSGAWQCAADGGGGASASYVTMPAANCQMGAAGTGFALPATLYPTPGCAAGANTLVGYLEWPDADGDYWAQATIPLIGTITSIDLAGKWRTSAISGDVVIQFQTACYANGESIDPIWNTAQTITDTAAATTLLANDFVLTGLSLTGCSTGETMLLRVMRNRTHASDTLAATMQLLSLTLTINR